MSAPEDDWRRMGQEASLPPGTRLISKTYQSPRPGWDHDHCSFCSVKFMAAVDAAQMAGEDVRTEGYTTTQEFERGADYEWVCFDCFADFSEEFGWVVVGS
jgi:hypothetical protein